MAHRKDHPFFGSGIPSVGARVIVALLVANAVAFSADKDKDKDRPHPAPAQKTQEHSPQPSARPAPAQQAPAQAPARPVFGGQSGPSNPSPARPGFGGQPAAQPGPSQAPARPGQPGPGSQPSARPGFGGQPSPSSPPSARPIFGGQPVAQPGQVPAHPGQPAPSQPMGRPGLGGPSSRPGETHPSAPFDHAPVPSHAPQSQRVIHTERGMEVHRAPDGRVREVHTADGGVILHSPGGIRRVELVRHDGARVVAIGHGGYVQRPMAFHGHTFVQRTYVVGGVAYPRVYRPWAYGGREYHIYTPMHHYRPGFYSWAYNPWARPVVYRWGWEARPWYGYYGGYYAPYPTYASPVFWLSDFVLAATLEAAYVSHAGAPPAAYGAPAPMSPEARQAIADEVRRQMEQAKADQASAVAYGPGMTPPPPPIFAANGPKTFLVSTEVSAYAGNTEVPLAEGAVVQLAAAPSPGSEFAEVQVLASRGSACPAGSYVVVRTTDLQEMQNHMQATIDQGLDKMQSGQGVAGLPAPPAQVRGAVNADFAAEVHADSAALNDLDAAVREADQSEQGLGTASVPPPPTQSVTLGMATYEVEAILGPPKNRVDVGSRKIYLYPNLKVTFTAGRVSDVN